MIQLLIAAALASGAAKEILRLFPKEPILIWRDKRSDRVNELADLIGMRLNSQRLLSQDDHRREQSK
jgi:hypothetical protein